LESASSKTVGREQLNGLKGIPYTWCLDSRSLLIHVLPEDRVRPKKALPTGQAFQKASGSIAPVRNHQDLLHNKLG
jgi:hypothetical protein